MLGNIGSRSYSKKYMINNIVFLVVILTFVTVELTTRFLPAYISIELRVNGMQKRLTAIEKRIGQG